MLTASSISTWTSRVARTTTATVARRIQRSDQDAAWPPRPSPTSASGPFAAAPTSISVTTSVKSLLNRMATSLLDPALASLDLLGLGTSSLARSLSATLSGVRPRWLPASFAASLLSAGLRGAHLSANWWRLWQVHAEVVLLGLLALRCLFADLKRLLRRLRAPNVRRYMRERVSSVVAGGRLRERERHQRHASTHSLHRESHGGSGEMQQHRRSASAQRLTPHAPPPYVEARSESQHSRGRSVGGRGFGRDGSADWSQGSWSATPSALPEMAAAAAATRQPDLFADWSDALADVNFWQTVLQDGGLVALDVAYRAGVLLPLVLFELWFLTALAATLADSVAYAAEVERAERAAAVGYWVLVVKIWRDVIKVAAAVEGRFGGIF